MLGGEAQSVIQIGIIEDDVCMDMLAVAVNGKHILIITFKIAVTKFFTDLHSLFRCNFTGSKALYQVVCKDFCSPCSSVSDSSEIFACPMRCRLGKHKS